MSKHLKKRDRGKGYNRTSNVLKRRAKAQRREERAANVRDNVPNVNAREAIALIRACADTNAKDLCAIISFSAEGAMLFGSDAEIATLREAMTLVFGEFQHWPATYPEIVSRLDFFEANVNALEAFNAAAASRPPWIDWMQARMVHEPITYGLNGRAVRPHLDVHGRPTSAPLTGGQFRLIDSVARARRLSVHAAQRHGVARAFWEYVAKPRVAPVVSHVDIGSGVISVGGEEIGQTCGTATLSTAGAAAVLRGTPGAPIPTVPESENVVVRGPWVAREEALDAAGRYAKATGAEGGRYVVTADTGEVDL